MKVRRTGVKKVLDFFESEFGATSGSTGDVVHPCDKILLESVVRIGRKVR